MTFKHALTGIVLVMIAVLVAIPVSGFARGFGLKINS